MIRMEPVHPALTAENDTTEPWRLYRLARVDGRVRAIMRLLTREVADEGSPLGEVVYARHVIGLHDDRGTLVAEVSSVLAGSPWFAVIAAALDGAWNAEDETEVAILRPDGTRARTRVMFAPLPVGASAR